MTLTLASRMKARGLALDEVVNLREMLLGRQDIADGEAHRTKVVLGRSSVNQIEIREGLQPGDQVILSDMSSYDQFDRVKLN